MSLRRCALLLACRPAADSAAPDRHVIPQGLVHVDFQGIDEAPAERLALRDAIAVRAAITHERTTAHHQLGPFDDIYNDLCARFLSGHVAHLWPRTSCLPA